MGFVLHSTAGLIAKNIAAWLSTQIIVCWIGINPISMLKLLSQAHWQLADASSMYSDSPTESATVF